MSNTPNFDVDTDRWKTENVLNLANHVHKLNTKNNQYERVKQFQLIDTVQDFEKKAKHITSPNCIWKYS